MLKSVWRHSILQRQSWRLALVVRQDHHEGLGFECGATAKHRDAVFPGPRERSLPSQNPIPHGELVEPWAANRAADRRSHRCYAVIESERRASAMARNPVTSQTVDGAPVHRSVTRNFS